MTKAFRLISSFFILSSPLLSQISSLATMFSHSTTKVSSEHVNRIVNSILNKKQRKVVEQQQTFLRRNTDENQKRNNYLVDKFTKKKCSKTDEEDENDFVSMKISTKRKFDSIGDNDEKLFCPICNENLSKLISFDEREQHVDRCLNKTTKISNENKAPSSNYSCEICGTSFNVKHLYLSHLKKCSNKNSIQLKHVVQFATKEEKKTIKNRIIQMEIPRTTDDEQQQLAIALSASMKTDVELPNAFELLQQATTKKRKMIDLAKTALWNVSFEDKQKISATRLSSLCERVIDSTTSMNSYKFPPSFLQNEFGHVDWWKITTTNPEDDEIPMTQLARILNDDDE